MEGKCAAGGGADLLMECDEEEQEVWSPSPETDEEEEEEEEDEGLMEEEMGPPPFRIPASVQPVTRCSPPTLNPTVKSSGGPLGFMVNGHLIPLLPGGGGVELKLCSHPRGSASGFTTVQIPITLTVHSPTGTRHIKTTASLTGTAASSTTPALNLTGTAPPEPEPEAGPTPIITGIVSGEAAQRVLSDHNVNFKSSPPLTDPRAPPTLSIMSPTTTPPTPRRTKAHSSGIRPAAPHKLLRKGQLGPASPPDCLICVSQYKLITELRGFMCLCSPAIAQSLKNLKKKNKSRKKTREKHRTSRNPRDPQSSSKGSKTRPGPPARTCRLSDDLLSDQFTSPVPPTSISSPQQDQSKPPVDPPQGKLVILVEDFYYGSAPGRSPVKPNQPNQTQPTQPKGRKFTGPYRCIHCPKTLSNNIELMNHMKQHVSMMSQEDGDLDSVSSCPHCFRHFMSQFKLQCHLEAVHSQYESTATCKICELEFGSEPAFLWHMKNTHKPGEMPYVCQVCDFRSSFYSDVLSHFHEAHADTKHLLCQYCLRVLRSNTCYQQHFARHQKKHVFGCDKCRLHFLYVKERIEHKLHHRTHIRPPQLTGLKPGTKVTVRTYSVVGGPESEEAVKRVVIPCKVVDVDPPPPPQEAPKRKVESLGLLLSSFSEAASVSRPPQRCVECLSVIRDFRAHFPSLVHCSLCRFITCCSTSYANHMIKNHATCRRSPQYQSIFQSDPRLSQRLKCTSCSLSTCRGDLMAIHLIEKPDHYRAHTDPSLNRTQPTHKANSVTSPGSGGRGAFIPIHLLPSGQTFTQLSVKPLTSPSPLSTPPAMTIKFLGPRPQSEQPLSVFQLSAVLSCLCHGLSQASQRHHSPHRAVWSWVRQWERGLRGRRWSWRTERLAEWLLGQRQQQLTVDEDVLLQAAKGALGEDSSPRDRYVWTVDFMLRHDLSLQFTTSIDRPALPRNIRENVHTFIQSLCSQIQDLPPHCLGSMDEFSIFIDPGRFGGRDPVAFQLCGASGDKPLFDIVLSALSDGTLLTPLLFFRGTPSHVPEGFPDNVLLEARREGFTDQEHLQIWIDKVWQPHVVSRCGGRSVLLVDLDRGHLANRFRDGLSSIATDIVFIPSGCGCRLQPLDVCVRPVLRDFLQARWTQLVSQGGLDGLGLDQLALTLACWLSEVSSTLNSETNFLCRSFHTVRDLLQVEDRREAASSIRALTLALIQPLEGPRPELELLLMMEEEKQEKMESREELEQEELMFDRDKESTGFQDN